MLTASPSPNNNSHLFANAPNIDGRTPNVVLKILSQQLRTALYELWAHFDHLDLRAHTTLSSAEQDLLASMPIIEGHENDIRDMVSILINDVRLATLSLLDSDHAPMSLRFVHQNTHDDISEITPADKNAHIIVLPVQAESSLHATLRHTFVKDELAALLDDTQERFVLIADPSVILPSEKPENLYAKTQEPLTPAQIEAYLKITRMLNQAMADVTGNFAARTALVGLVGSVQQMLQRLNSYNAAVALPQESAAIRKDAVQVEQQIKSQISNMVLSDTLRQTLRAGLQQLQALRVDPAKAKSRITNILTPRTPELRAAIHAAPTATVVQSLAKSVVAPTIPRLQTANASGAHQTLSVATIKPSLIMASSQTSPETTRQSKIQSVVSAQQPQTTVISKSVPPRTISPSQSPTASPANPSPNLLGSSTKPGTPIVSNSAIAATTPQVVATQSPSIQAKLSVSAVNTNPIHTSTPVQNQASSTNHTVAQTRPAAKAAQPSVGTATQTPAIQTQRPSTQPVQSTNTGVNTTQSLQSPTISQLITNPSTHNLAAPAHRHQSVSPLSGITSPTITAVSSSVLVTPHTNGSSGPSTAIRVSTQATIQPTQNPKPVSLVSSTSQAGTPFAPPTPPPAGISTFSVNQTTPHNIRYVETVANTPTAPSVSVPISPAAAAPVMTAPTSNAGAIFSTPIPTAANVQPVITPQAPTAPAISQTSDVVMARAIQGTPIAHSQASVLASTPSTPTTSTISMGSISTGAAARTTQPTPHNPTAPVARTPVVPTAVSTSMPVESKSPVSTVLVNGVPTTPQKTSVINASTIPPQSGHAEPPPAKATNSNTVTNHQARTPGLPTQVTPPVVVVKPAPVPAAKITPSSQNTPTPLSVAHAPFPKNTPTAFTVTAKTTVVPPPAISKPEQPPAKPTLIGITTRSDADQKIPAEMLKKFRAAAKGVCADCKGGNCAACTKPVFANNPAIANLFANHTK
jgi:hypothetical protein